MKLRAALLSAVLGLAFPAWGAGALDALRAGSRAAREHVEQLRAEQLEKRNALSVLSSRIETLKTQAKGRLLPGGELDRALKASQELSGALTDLAQQASARQTELEAANLALLDGLSGELERLRADFDRETDRSQRKGLIERLRRLRAERDALRAALPTAQVPALNAVKASDDPEELLEQADLLRDNQEKLQKDLKALEVRIAERREEAELDRRVQRFLGEEGMFDDQDRRLRLQRPGENEAAAQTGSAGPIHAGSGPQGSAFNTTSDTPIDRGQPALGGSNKGGVSGSDARPQIGSAGPIASGDEDLEDLEVQRAKLKGLADELERKAAELERRARELR